MRRAQAIIGESNDLSRWLNSFAEFLFNFNSIIWRIDITILIFAYLYEYLIFDVTFVYFTYDDFCILLKLETYTVFVFYAKYHIGMLGTNSDFTDQPLDARRCKFATFRTRH